MVSFHGGFLWLDKKVFVDVKLIETITILPLAGIDPTPYFRKYDSTMLVTKMKDKYDLCRYTRGFLIKSINVHTVRFIAKVLDTKLLKKM